MSRGILSRFISTQVVVCISTGSHPALLIEGELEYVRMGKAGHPHFPTLLVLNEKNRRHIIRDWSTIGRRKKVVGRPRKDVCRTIVIDTA